MVVDMLGNDFGFKVKFIIVIYFIVVVCMGKGWVEGYFFLGFFFLERKYLKKLMIVLISLWNVDLLFMVIGFGVNKMIWKF